MKCFRCLTEFQRDERDGVTPAEYVYNGQSLCLEHLNSVRGWPAGYKGARTDGVRP